MITQEFYEEMIFHLSGTLVDVEMDIEDVDMAFKQALRKYKQRGADNHDRAFLQLQVEPGKNEYDIPEQVNTINSIIRPKSTAGLHSNDPFSQSIIQDYFAHNTHGGGHFMLYHLTMNIIENNRMYTATEPNFRFSRSNNKMTLMNPPKRSQTWLMDVYTTMDTESYQEIMWVRDWTLAECKQILGRAYRQFGTIPSPHGDTQTDGDTLVQEAQQEKQDLLEQIDDFVDGEPDGMAIIIG